MQIRKASISDIDTIMDIYEAGRALMRAAGNPNQWVNGYPSRELIEGDIACGNCYVIEDESGILHGVFAFIVGDDPTYSVIEDGSWLNDEPYGTIHRIASDGTMRGILAAAVGFALDQTGNVRVDTHEDNKPMQGALAKAGFKRCGIIYCVDGTPRIAYQLKG